MPKSLDELSSDDARKLLALSKRGLLELNAGSFAALIGKLDAEDILNSRELEYWKSVANNGPKLASSSNRLAPTLVLVLKVTRLCNLRCSYCRSWAEGPDQVMSFPVMVETVMQAVSSPTTKSIMFVLHGGEVTLLKPRVLEKLIWIQEKLRRPDQVIQNAVQTNAVSISDDWIRLFKTLKMPIGISLDGPPELNDRVRVDKQGRPSSGRVATNMVKLREAGLSYGGLVVVGDEAIRIGARPLFDYFLSVGLRNVDLLNELPGNEALQNGTHRCTNYVSFDVFVELLVECFRVWFSEYSDQLDIRCLTELFLAAGKMAEPKSCLWSGDCLSKIFTIEANGDLAACDKYIGDRSFIYGNLLAGQMGDLIKSSKLIRAEAAAQERASDRASTCKWNNLCHGGCPHDRYLFKNAAGITDRSCCGLSPLLDAMCAAIEDHPEQYAQFLRARGHALRKTH